MSHSQPRQQIVGSAALLPMGRRRHVEDGPSRFIPNGSMPQLPLSTHCLGPPGWLSSLDLRQRKPTIFRKPTGGVSK